MGMSSGGPLRSAFVVTAFPVPRMAVLVRTRDGVVPQTEVAIPPAHPARDKVFALTLHNPDKTPDGNAVLVTDITHGPGVGYSFDANPFLIALVKVPMCASAIRGADIVTGGHVDELPLITDRQLRVEYMDNEERFYSLNEEGASWREGKIGLVYRGKPGPSRLHIPWRNVRTYEVLIRRQGQPDA